MTAEKWAGFLVGLAGGAVLAAAPLAAFDPPAQREGAAPPQQAPGHGRPVSRQPGGRFAPWSGDLLQVADASYHDDAPGPPIGFRGCSLFEDKGFAGRRGDAPAGSRLGWVGQPLDDRVSAVACSRGCRLIASEDINHTGARRTFRGNTSDVGSAWNDRISALRVACSDESH